MTVLDSCTYDYNSDSKFVTKQELVFHLEWKERSSKMCFSNFVSTKCNSIVLETIIFIGVL